MSDETFRPRGPELPSLAGAEWLSRLETRVVLAAFNFAGVPARIVGGAVRNALLGRAVKDIDIATPALPDRVSEIAKNAGLDCIPTGIDHGTVTIIANHTPFEITTLRRDVETDGRRATVAFTDDWTEDASRRDFTINALYCDADGQIFDPLDGYPDILARRVRFIGRAEDRIREDYLRILRFFRFTAEYTDGQPDAAGLAASRDLADGLSRVSAERIRAELLRLLVAPGAVTAIHAMDRAGILGRILGKTPRPECLARLAAIEEALKLDPDALRRLAVLAVRIPGAALSLRDALKLSTAEYERIAHMSLPERAYDPQSPESDAKAAIYRHDPEGYRDGLLYAWATGELRHSDPRMQDRLRLAERWSPPEFPVRGQDLLHLGVPSGPEVGRILRTLEDWWIGAGFPTDPAILARRLNDLVKVSRS
ncbi:MAG: CCA tRNA nucleotidyltransferase [Hyphomicrobium sp.]|nr:CCA tRNA nucleotidyltransferase [Hyphomicrobium sp.]